MFSLQFNSTNHAAMPRCCPWEKLWWHVYALHVGICQNQNWQPSPHLPTTSLNRDGSRSESHNKTQSRRNSGKYITPPILRYESWSCVAAEALLGFIENTLIIIKTIIKTFYFTTMWRTKNETETYNCSMTRTQKSAVNPMINKDNINY